MFVADQEYDQIMQTCLEAVQSGQASIDSILSAYPELADTLRPELEAIVWLHQQRRSFDPRPGFVGASRRRLTSRIRQEEATRHTARARKDPWWAGLFGRKQLALQLSLVVLLMVAFVFGGSGMAFASRSSIPGEMLYPVKLGLEQVELRFAFRPEARARLMIEHIEHRMLELQALSLDGQWERLPETVARFETQVEQAIAAVTLTRQQDPLRGNLLAASLEDALADQDVMFGILSQAAPEAARPQFVRASQASTYGVTVAQELLALPTITPPVAALTATPTQTVGAGKSPSHTPGAYFSPSPTNLPQATATPQPDAGNSGQGTPGVSEKPSATHKPSNTPQPTNTNRPTMKPTNTTKPKNTPQPTNEHRPTKPPKPEKETEPTQKPPKKP